MKEIVVALAGNPNSGKTTVFNAITGSRQHVGNYPGVTVEKKEGTVKRGDVVFKIVDLPGTYSLSAASPEEVVARDFLVNEHPDVVVHVLDASNLERNLYLAVQLMELGVKLVFALNMSDVAKAKGIEFDLEKLSSLIKAPVVPTVGNKKTGINNLLDAVAKAVEAPKSTYETIHYPNEILIRIAKIDALLAGEDRVLGDTYPKEWFAARAVEGDTDILSRIKSLNLSQAIRESRDAFVAETEDLPEIIMTEARYGWIAGLVAESVKFTPEARLDISDRIDSVALNRVLGLPIFLLMMYLVFQLVFTLAEPPMEWIETAFSNLGQWISQLWPRGVDSPLRDLLVDGIIGGVGGVLVFLPNIILLFLAIAFLEGTGYMARAAFLMDRLMNKIGLHGKSFIPMLLGFGCTVPAIMGTRTLENRRDRLATILVLPFMSCGARLPIYALIIPAFFPQALHAWMLWLIYMIGIGFAIIGAKFLRTTLFKGESVPFVMELPPYRMPTLRAVFTLMWDRTGEYCKKAGTIILGVSILLWAMTAYPKKEDFTQDYDADRQQIDAKFTEDLKTLGDVAAVQTNLLVEWQEATSAREEIESTHWEKEPGYSVGEQGYEKTMNSLYSQPGGDNLKSFADANIEITAIEKAFDGATNDLEEDSPEYVDALKAKQQALAELKYPANILVGVNRYRHELLAVRDEAQRDIDNAEEGEQLAHSISGRVGTFLEPAVKPIGFDWRIATAIIGSFAAKEVFVAQMGIVYSVGEADEHSETLREKLQQNYTPLQGFCMMLYALLSLPCVATIAVARRETGGWRYAIGMMIGLTLIAYVATLVVYQVGMVLGIGVA